MSSVVLSPRGTTKLGEEGEERTGNVGKMDVMVGLSVGGGERCDSNECIRLAGIQNITYSRDYKYPYLYPNQVLLFAWVLVFDG